VSPSLFTQHGVYQNDVLKPRTKEEIKLIFKNIGNDIPSDLFDHIWEEAQSKNPYNEVSVEEFRAILGRFNTRKLQSESKSEVSCS
jgi:Ca2+-binding EF-hand superfamily protein